MAEPMETETPDAPLLRHSRGTAYVAALAGMSVGKLVSKQATRDTPGPRSRWSLVARVVSPSSITRSLMLLEPTLTARMFTSPTLPDDFEWGGSTALRGDPLCCGPGSARRCRVTPSGRLLVRIEAVQIPVVDRTRKVYLRECHTASESFGFSG